MADAAVPQSRVKVAGRPSQKNYRRQTCRLCDSRDLELVLELTPTPLADAYVPPERAGEVQETYPLDLFLCRRCGLSQLLDVIHPEEIYLDYIYETASSLGLAEHFQRYADEAVRRINPSKGSLAVDLGSNDGILLKAFKHHGLRVLGVEPAKRIAQQATAAGLETVPSFFTAQLGRQIRAERGPASIITTNNLFANIDELADFTSGVRDLLAPDGVYIFESFYLADWMEHLVFDFTYHEHLSYFSVKPLEAFFRHLGMELIDVQRIPTKGGSLRYTAQRADGPRPVAPAVAELLALEERLGLHRPEAFRAYAAQIDRAKQELWKLLGKLTGQGKTIIGYGASATTTTLVYHFNLGSVLSVMVDDNPSKVGLRSPGLHIPVLPSQAIEDRKPDYVLILAWRYVEPIIKKHEAFLRQGGRFIVPLPELRVIEPA